MTKTFRPLAVFFLISFMSFLQHGHAQLSDAEKQERCKNNKIRIADLEAQIQGIDADLSFSMGEKQLEDTRTQLVYIKSIRYGKAKMDAVKFNRISANHNFNLQDCIDAARGSNRDPYGTCLANLEKKIAAKIDKSLSYNRPRLLAQKEEVNKQLEAYRNNLKSLGCDGQAGGQAGGCQAEGSWAQDTPGIGPTTWQINSDGTANETGIGYAQGTATLTGKTLRIDWKTNTGYSGYYEWNLNEDCRTGEGTLVFKTGRTDSLTSTVKRN